MKIYTKGGDQGETSLIGGARVLKNHSRIEAYGTIDELNAIIGIVRDSSQNASADEQLEAVQNILFSIGSALAAADGHKMQLPDFEETAIKDLEKAIDLMDEELEPLRNFILPGGDLASSYCHLARTVCRRAERKVVAMQQELQVEPKIVKYLNRLSDYFFTLGRFYTKLNSGKETLWNPRKA
ncbi:MAG: cob(I)yrinic acid a,c-diamide adenosyltransferase [Bacteroidetes bacterium]|nr:MAG: cob(I)yrinic acid a,c-diamide adenosyltransferase [Bacteroidota bacterium]